MSNWPDWWEWELDVSNPHLREQMVVRRFNEVDLRGMMESGTKVRPDHEPGRWVLETQFDDEDWEVVLEPDEPRKRLVVVTAYAVY
jgi:hypothetical protein